jgi:uncharacterized protein YkwD
MPQRRAVQPASTRQLSISTWQIYPYMDRWHEQSCHAAIERKDSNHNSMSCSLRKFLAALSAGAGLVLCSACTVSELHDYSTSMDPGELPEAPVSSVPGDDAESAPAPLKAPASSPEALSRDLFERVNAYRKSRGLRKLKWNDNIAGIAAAHSRKMSASSALTHKGFNKRVNSLRRMGILTVSENLAYYRGQSASADVALQLWLDSPAHYKNLSGKKYTMTGVGCGVNSQGYVYFAQLYGR